jgi:hypothetical protein
MMGIDKQRRKKGYQGHEYDLLIHLFVQTHFSMSTSVIMRV